MTQKKFSPAFLTRVRLLFQKKGVYINETQMICTLRDASAHIRKKMAFEGFPVPSDDEQILKLLILIKKLKWPLKSISTSNTQSGTKAAPAPSRRTRTPKRKHSKRSSVPMSPLSSVPAEMIVNQMSWTPTTSK